MASEHAQRVAAAAWPWREASGPQGESPARRRRRALTEVAVMGAVAALCTWVLRRPALAVVVCGVASVVLVGGLFVPPLYAGIKKAGLALGKGVGVFLSLVLLVPFFYLCFPVGRLLFALARKDPLRRGYDPAAATYWGAKGPAAGPARYRKQF